MSTDEIREFEFSDGQKIELLSVGGGWPPAFFSFRCSVPGREAEFPTCEGDWLKEKVRKPSVEECLVVIRELRDPDSVADEVIRMEAKAAALRRLADLLSVGADGTKTVPLVDRSGDSDA